MRRVLSRSLGRKLTATCIAVAGFVLLLEVSMFDLRHTGLAEPVDPTLPVAGARVAFTATAYCKGTTTASGVSVRTGIAAADPGILPVGSVVNVATDDPKYNGVYTIMDTGPRVQGRLIDVYIWSCHEALKFGRRPVEVTVLRYGWNPRASTPSLMERLFRRREAPPPPAPPQSSPPSPIPSAAPVVSADGPAEIAEIPAVPAEAEAPIETDTPPLLTAPPP
jgi:3D (Asp-Asp-Asp) domain-containing protein